MGGVGLLLNHTMIQDGLACWVSPGPPNPPLISSMGACALRCFLKIRKSSTHMERTLARFQSCTVQFHAPLCPVRVPKAYSHRPMENWSFTSAKVVTGTTPCGRSWSDFPSVHQRSRRLLKISSFPHFQNCRCPNAMRSCTLVSSTSTQN